MTDYRVWNAWQPAPTVVEGAVLDCDTWFLGTGTAELVDAAARALGIKARPATWSLRPVRTNYYAPHRAAARSWGDVWNVAWLLHLAWTAPVTLRAGRDAVGFDGVDPSHAAGSPYDWPEIPCVVIADLRDDEAAARADAALAELGWPARIGRGFGRFPQRLIELGPRPRSYFEAGAAEAEAVVDRLAALGASTNLLTSQAWAHAARRAARSAP